MILRTRRIMLLECGHSFGRCIIASEAGWLKIAAKAFQPMTLLSNSRPELQNVESF
jgi:hypothetical protein